MRNLIFICSLFVCVACKEVSFREPQPKGKKSLTSVPKSLQGKYLAQKEGGELAQDTVVIYSNGYRFGYFSPEERLNHKDDLDEGVLSDSLVLRTYKNYYFVNFLNRPEWLLRVLEKQKNGDLIYMAPEQEGVDFKDYVVKLSSEIRIDSTEVDGKRIYLIDPTPRELVGLIEKGYFSRTLLKKVQ
ncbi:MAG TPA: hypothetical protein VD927_09745 [Chryseosolibacter sp.]|nr:hypothetical protein [Chryseosolibacter sp.]